MIFKNLNTHTIQSPDHEIFQLQINKSININKELNSMTLYLEIQFLASQIKRVILISLFIHLQQQNLTFMEIKLPLSSKAIVDKAKTIKSNSQSFVNDEKNRSQSAINRQKTYQQKQHSGSQSPISVRFAKTSSKLIDQPLSHMQQINQTQDQISHLIDELDIKLQSNYHQKQLHLMQAYRQQLIRSHKQLMDLKNNNNQQQIKNQMNEKFLQLKKQRLQLIQANMFYSNKCQEYKQLLNVKLNEGYELEREIKFLENQINNSNKKKIQLMSQLYQNSSPLKVNSSQNDNTDSQRILSLNNINFETSKKERNDQSTPNKKISLSTHANSEVMRKMGLTQHSKDKLKIHPNKIPLLNSQVKKIFDQKLLGSQNFNTDRSTAKSGAILTKISSLHNENSFAKKQTQKQPSQIQRLFIKTVNEVKENKGLKKQIELFKGEQFTDLQKKQIMKAFLSKDQVKQYIYNIIFDKTQDSGLFKKKALKEKFKIVASDKKQGPYQ